MRIKYPGPHLEVEVEGHVCRRGETVDLPTDLAKRLVEQGWVKVAKPRKPKTKEQ
jgi:hypothetical protein